jgi:hypothetical protein
MEDWYTMTNRSAIATKDSIHGTSGVHAVRQPMVEIPKSELMDILKNLEGVKRKLQNRLNIQA